MTTEPEEIFDGLPNLDDEDLWVRGQVYVQFKRLLEETEARLPGLERKAARARYEYDIVQRIQDKVTDPQDRQDWEIRASVAHDIMVMIEHDLAEVADSAAYYRAMVTEIEADLGDKAQEYETLLSQFDLEEDWDEEEFEDWDEDDFDELEDEEFDLFAPIPFMDDEDDWEDDEDGEEGDGPACEETPL
jgi:hypothetical protein